MAFRENVEILADEAKNKLTASGKEYLNKQLNKTTKSFESATVSIVKKLKQDVTDVSKQLKEIYITAEKDKKKINKDTSLTEGEKKVKISNIDEAVSFEKELLELDIEIKKQELANLTNAYSVIVLKAYDAEKKNVLDSYLAKKNYTTNAIKIKPSYADVVVIISVLANIILSQVSIGNKRIEGLVDRVLELIDGIKQDAAASDLRKLILAFKNSRIDRELGNNNLLPNGVKTQQDVLKARILVNNAKRIIADNRKKLETIDTILSVIEILIPILKALLILFKVIPIPTAFLTIGITNTAAAIQKKVDDILLTATTILNIAQLVIRKLLEDLNYQESRLRPIDDILDKDLVNLSAGEISDLLNSNNSGFGGTNIMAETGTGIGTGIGNKIGGATNLLNINGREVNGLGYLEGYDYKGFKFYLLEENNPKFVVKGNKRRYGVAKNKSGIEVLQSNYSFTLSPEVLVEELKLQIDQKGLVS
jgi:hypothetical protein